MDITAGLLLALVVIAPLNARTPGPDDAVQARIEAVQTVKVYVEYQQVDFGFMRVTASPLFAVRMTIMEVAPGSAAARAGLQKGMEIVAVAGEKVAGKRQDEIDRMLREPHDPVVFLVRTPRSKKPRQIRFSPSDPPPRDQEGVPGPQSSGRGQSPKRSRIS